MRVILFVFAVLAFIGAFTSVALWAGPCLVAGSVFLTGAVACEGLQAIAKKLDAFLKKLEVQ